MEKCPHETIADAETGEVACIRCGMVVDVLREDAPAHQESRLSLHQQKELGGDPQDAREFRPRIHDDSSRDLSEFSNLCDKLRLPDFAKREAWILYRKSRSLGRRTRAMCALYSVFAACRNSGHGVHEEQIRDAIRPALGVKNVPSILKTLVAFGGTATRRPSLYYLNVEIASVQGKFTRREDFDSCKILAHRRYWRLSGNDRSRAKRAVAAALSEMGVRR